MSEYNPFIFKELFLETTWACNQRCKYCYMETNRELSKNELTTEEYRDLLKYLAEKSNTLFLTFTGGEFFLRKDAIELTRIASEFNYCFSILSNGTLINEKIADALAETVPLKIRFTLFSYIPELHDDFTRSKGSFDKTIKAIKLMRERDITTHISYPIVNITKEINFDNICKFMDDLGVQFTLSTTILPPRSRNCEDQSKISFFSDSNEFSKIADDMKKYVEKNNEHYSTDIEQSNSLTDNVKKTGLYIPCSAGVNSLAINPYGDISPCAMFFDSAVLGNVRNDDILDIFKNHSFLKEIRNYSPEKRNEICLACEKKNSCNICIAQSYIENKDIYAPSKASCQLAKWTKEVKENERKVQQTSNH